MQKIIDVRFGTDNFLKDEEKLSYVRYLNRILSALKEDIISNRGYINVISKKGAGTSITFMSDNNDLNKLVTTRLFNASPFQD